MIELPDFGPWNWVRDSVLWVASGGGAWPETNEDRVRELAEAWRYMAQRIADGMAQTSPLASQLAQDWGGEAGAAFAELWSQLGQEVPQELLEAITGSRGVVNFLETAALDVEYTKLTMVIEVSVLILELFVLAVMLWLSMGGAAAVGAGRIAASRQTVAALSRQLVEKASQWLTEQSLRTSIKSLLARWAWTLPAAMGREVTAEGVKTSVAQALQMYVLQTRGEFNRRLFFASTLGGAAGAFANIGRMLLSNVFRRRWHLGFVEPLGEFGEEFVGGSVGASIMQGQLAFSLDNMVGQVAAGVVRDPISRVQLADRILYTTVPGLKSTIEQLSQRMRDLFGPPMSPEQAQAMATAVLGAQAETRALAQSAQATAQQAAATAAAQAQAASSAAVQAQGEAVMMARTRDILGLSNGGVASGLDAEVARQARAAAVALDESRLAQARADFAARQAQIATEAAARLDAAYENLANARTVDEAIAAVEAIRAAQEDAVNAVLALEGMDTAFAPPESSSTATESIEEVPVSEVRSGRDASVDDDSMAGRETVANNGRPAVGGVVEPERTAVGGPVLRPRVPNPAVRPFDRSETPPDTAEPGRVEPERAKPDTATPETAGPDTAMPDTAIPDGATPVGPVPNGATPSPTGPGVVPPGTPAPDRATRDGVTPNGAAPTGTRPTGPTSDPARPPAPVANGATPPGANQDVVDDDSPNSVRGEPARAGNSTVEPNPVVAVPVGSGSVGPSATPSGGAGRPTRFGEGRAFVPPEGHVAATAAEDQAVAAAVAGPDGNPVVHPSPFRSVWVSRLNAGGVLEPGRAENSAELVHATLSTWYGRPTAAGRNVAGTPTPLRHLEDFLGTEFTPVPVDADAAARLTDALTSLGPGSAAAILVRRGPDDPGRALAALNDDGRVAFVDPHLSDEPMTDFPDADAVTEFAVVLLDPTGVPVDAGDIVEAFEPVTLDGTRRDPRPEPGTEAEWEWARRQYERFRADDSDIRRIAANLEGVRRPDGRVGFSVGELRLIKEHLMVREHWLDRNEWDPADLPTWEYEGRVYVRRRFDEDPEVAETWQRLIDGQYQDTDQVLLLHELAEAGLELVTEQSPLGRIPAREAHRLANELYNWEALLGLGGTETEGDQAGVAGLRQTGASRRTPGAPSAQLGPSRPTSVLRQVLAAAARDAGQHGRWIPRILSATEVTSGATGGRGSLRAVDLTVHLRGATFTVRVVARKLTSQDENPTLGPEQTARTTARGQARPTITLDPRRVNPVAFLYHELVEYAFTNLPPAALRLPKAWTNSGLTAEDAGVLAEIMMLLAEIARLEGESNPDPALLQTLYQEIDARLADAGYLGADAAARWQAADSLIDPASLDDDLRRRYEDLRYRIPEVVAALAIADEYRRLKADPAATVDQLESARQGFAAAVAALPDEHRHWVQRTLPAADVELATAVIAALRSTQSTGPMVTLADVRDLLMRLPNATVEYVEGSGDRILRFTPPQSATTWEVTVGPTFGSGNSRVASPEESSARTIVVSDEIPAGVDIGGLTYGHVVAGLAVARELRDEGSSLRQELVSTALAHIVRTSVELALSGVNATVTRGTNDDVSVVTPSGRVHKLSISKISEAVEHLFTDESIDAVPAAVARHVARALVRGGIAAELIGRRQRDVEVALLADLAQAVRSGPGTTGRPTLPRASAEAADRALAAVVHHDADRRVLRLRRRLGRSVQSRPAVQAVQARINRPTSRQTTVRPTPPARQQPAGWFDRLALTWQARPTAQDRQPLVEDLVAALIEDNRSRIAKRVAEYSDAELVVRELALARLAEDRDDKPVDVHRLRAEVAASLAIAEHGPRPERALGAALTELAGLHRRVPPGMPEEQVEASRRAAVDVAGEILAHNPGLRRGSLSAEVQAFAETAIQQWRRQAEEADGLSGLRVTRHLAEAEQFFADAQRDPATVGNTELSGNPLVGVLRDGYTPSQDELTGVANRLSVLLDRLDQAITLLDDRARAHRRASVAKSAEAASKMAEADEERAAREAARNAGTFHDRQSPLREARARRDAEYAREEAEHHRRVEDTYLEVIDTAMHVMAGLRLARDAVAQAPNRDEAVAAFTQGLDAYRAFAEAVQRTLPLREVLSASVPLGDVPGVRALARAINTAANTNLSAAEVGARIQQRWRAVVEEGGAAFSFTDVFGDDVEVQVAWTPEDGVELAVPMLAVGGFGVPVRVTETIWGQIPTYIAGRNLVSHSRSRSFSFIVRFSQALRLWLSNPLEGESLGARAARWATRPLRGLLDPPEGDSWLARAAQSLGRWVGPPEGDSWHARLRRWLNEHVNIAGETSHSWKRAARMVAGQYTMGGGVMDNRGPATAYSYLGTWTVTVRPVAGPENTFTVRPGEDPDDAVTATLVVPDSLTEPAEPAAEMVRVPRSPNVTVMPGYALTGITHLKRLFDDIVGDLEQAGISVDASARNRLGVLIYELYPNRLTKTGYFRGGAIDQSLSNGLHELLEVDGHEVLITLRTEIDLGDQPGSGRQPQALGRASRRVILEKLAVVFNVARTGSDWERGISRSVVASLIGRLIKVVWGRSKQNLDMGGGRGRTYAAATTSGGTAIRPNVNKWQGGPTRLWRLPVRHVYDVQVRENSREQFTDVAQKQHGPDAWATVLLAEEDAFALGLPVNREHTVESGGQREFAQRPPVEHGRLHRPPAWAGADGVGPAMLGELDGFGDARQELFEKLKDLPGFDDELAERRAQAVLADPTTEAEFDALVQGVVREVEDRSGRRRRVYIRLTNLTWSDTTDATERNPVVLFIGSEAHDLGSGYGSRLGGSAGAGTSPDDSPTTWDPLSASGGMGGGRGRGTSLGTSLIGNLVTLNEAGDFAAFAHKLEFTIEIKIEEADFVSERGNANVYLPVGMSPRDPASFRFNDPPAIAGSDLSTVLSGAKMLHLDARDLIDLGDPWSSGSGLSGSAPPGSASSNSRSPVKIADILGGVEPGSAIEQALRASFSRDNLVAAGTALLTRDGLPIDVLPSASEQVSSLPYFRNAPPEPHADVQIRFRPREVTYVGPTDDGVLGHIFMAMASHSVSQQRTGDGNLGGGLGDARHVGDHTPGADVSGSGSWARTRSRTMTRTGADEGLVVRTGGQYIYTVLTERVITVDGRDYSAGEGRVVLTFTERAALRGYLDGVLPMQLDDVLDALGRYANGHLDLDRRTALRLLAKAKEEVSKSSNWRNQTAYQQMTAASQELIGHPALLPTEALASRLAREFSSEEFPSIPVISGNAATYLTELLDWFDRNPNVSEVAAETSKQLQRLLKNQRLVVGESRIDDVTLETTRGMVGDGYARLPIPADLRGGRPTLLDIVRDRIEILSPEAERRNPDLHRALWGLLGGDRAWQGLYEAMTRPEGWRRSFLDRHRGYAQFLDVSIRIEPKQDPVPMGPESQALLMAQRYAYDERTDVVSRDWSWTIDPSGRDRTTELANLGVSGGVPFGSGRSHVDTYAEQGTRIDRINDTSGGYLVGQKFTMVVEVKVRRLGRTGRLTRFLLRNRMANAVVPRSRSRRREALAALAATSLSQSIDGTLTRLVPRDSLLDEAGNPRPLPRPSEEDLLPDPRALVLSQMSYVRDADVGPLRARIEEALRHHIRMGSDDWEAAMNSLDVALSPTHFNAMVKAMAQGHPLVTIRAGRFGRFGRSGHETIEVRINARFYLRSVRQRTWGEPEHGYVHRGQLTAGRRAVHSTDDAMSVSADAKALEAMGLSSAVPKLTLRWGRGAAVENIHNRGDRDETSLFVVFPTGLYEIAVYFDVSLHRARKGKPIGVTFLPPGESGGMRMLLPRDSVYGEPEARAASGWPVHQFSGPLTGPDVHDYGHLLVRAAEEPSFDPREPHLALAQLLDESRKRLWERAWGRRRRRAQAEVGPLQVFVDRASARQTPDALIQLQLVARRLGRDVLIDVEEERNGRPTRELYMALPDGSLVSRVPGDGFGAARSTLDPRYVDRVHRLRGLLGMDLRTMYEQYRAADPDHSFSEEVRRRLAAVGPGPSPAALGRAEAVPNSRFDGAAEPTATDQVMAAIRADLSAAAALTVGGHLHQLSDVEERNGVFTVTVYRADVAIVYRVSVGEVDPRPDGRTPVAQRWVERRLDEDGREVVDEVGRAVYDADIVVSYTAAPDLVLDALVHDLTESLSFVLRDHARIDQVDGDDRPGDGAVSEPGARRRVSLLRAAPTPHDDGVAAQLVVQARRLADLIDKVTPTQVENALQRRSTSEWEIVQTVRATWMVAALVRAAGGTGRSSRAWQGIVNGRSSRQDRLLLERMRRLVNDLLEREHEEEVERISDRWLREAVEATLAAFAMHTMARPAEVAEAEQDVVDDILSRMHSVERTQPADLASRPAPSVRSWSVPTITGGRDMSELLTLAEAVRADGGQVDPAGLRALFEQMPVITVPPPTDGNERALRDALLWFATDQAPGDRTTLRRVEAGGSAAAVFLVTDPGRPTRVVKVFADPERMAQELSALQRFRPDAFSGFPVPTALAAGVMDNGQAIRGVLVTSYLGHSLADVFNSVNDWHRYNGLRQMAQALRRLHTADSGGTAADYVRRHARRLEYWMQRILGDPALYARYGLHDVDLVRDRVAEVIAAAIADPGPASFVHGDLTPGNVTYDTSTGTVGFIDLWRAHLAFDAHGQPAGSAAHDLAFFEQHLYNEARVRWFSHDGANELVNVFWEAYGEPPVPRAVMTMFRLRGLIRSIGEEAATAAGDQAAENRVVVQVRRLMDLLELRSRDVPGEPDRPLDWTTWTTEHRHHRDGCAAEGPPFFNRGGDLDIELHWADWVGVKPVSPGERGFDETVNAGPVKWAILHDGTLLVIPHTVDGSEIFHTAIARGSPVWAAGEAEITAIGGVLIGWSISNHSGHYTPCGCSLDYALRVFERHGIVFYQGITYADP